VTVVPHQGASAVQTRLRDAASELIRSDDLLDARHSYRIVPLSAPPGAVLRAGGETLHAPWLLPQSGELTALACGVCTLGPKLEQCVSELFAQRRVSLALALDQLGNELLFAVCRRLQDRMLAQATRRGLTMAGELRPGDPGLALDAQTAVLRLADAHRIGVSLSCRQFMRPLKSTSMVLGVGVDLPPARWSRCDDCPSRPKCVVARRADAATLT
jgi:hypothetical protein